MGVSTILIYTWSRNLLKNWGEFIGLYLVFTWPLLGLLTRNRTWSAWPYLVTNLHRPWLNLVPKICVYACFFDFMAFKAYVAFMAFTAFMAFMDLALITI